MRSVEEGTVEGALELQEACTLCLMPSGPWVLTAAAAELSVVPGGVLRFSSW